MESIDSNSLYLDEVLPRIVIRIKKDVHGNVKQALGLRGKKLYHFIDNIDRDGGLPAFYRRFPGVHKTIVAIRTGQPSPEHQKEYVRLWGQINRAYHKKIEFEESTN